MTEKKHYVYMVQCANGALYTGWTTDLTRRIQAHNCGKGAKYTRGRGPVLLVYSEQMESRSDALKRECAIKKLSRPQKLALIKSCEDIGQSSKP